jgi:hypothetical protein
MVAAARDLRRRPFLDGRVRMVSLLMLANTVCFVGLVALYSIHGPGIYVDGATVALASIYFVLLSVTLYGFRASTRSVTLILGFIGIIFYAQRWAILLAAPETNRYSSYVAMDAADTNHAGLFLVMTWAALLVGLKLAEVVPPRVPKPNRGWTKVPVNRWVVYALGTGITFVHAVLLATAFAHGRNYLTSNILVSKILLQFVSYDGIYVLLTVLFLVDRAIEKSKSERRFIIGYLVLYSLFAASYGHKSAIVDILLIYWFCQLVLRDFTISRRLLALTATAILALAGMFAVHNAVRASLYYPHGPSFQERWATAVEQFELDYRGYPDTFLQLSRRLGGIDWLMLETHEPTTSDLRAVLSLRELFQSAANRLVPTPRPIYPDVVGVAAAIPLVVRRLPSQALNEFQEYPTMLGWLYLVFGYWAVPAAVVFGLILGLLVRRSISRITELLVLSYLVWDFVLGGVLVESLKTLLIYWLILTLLRMLFGLRRTWSTGREKRRLSHAVSGA